MRWGQGVALVLQKLLYDQPSLCRHGGEEGRTCSISAEPVPGNFKTFQLLTLKSITASPLASLEGFNHWPFHHLIDVAGHQELFCTHDNSFASRRLINSHRPLLSQKSWRVVLKQLDYQHREESLDMACLSGQGSMFIAQPKFPVKLIGKMGKNIKVSLSHLYCGRAEVFQWSH